MRRENAAYPISNATTGILLPVTERIYCKTSRRKNLGFEMRTSLTGPNHTGYLHQAQRQLALVLHE